MSANYPKRIRASRRKGDRAPTGSVLVARPTRWGNPFDWKHLGKPEAVRAYREWLLRDRAGMQLLERARGELAGNDLRCWCALDEPCHADVLIELVNRIVTASPEEPTQCDG